MTDNKPHSIRRWLTRIIVGLLALLIIFLTFTTVNAAIGDKQVFSKKLPANSRLIDVGGRHIHIHEMGEAAPGEPTVVFVGCFGCTSGDWQAVQPGISEFARTISFDPAGYTWSDPGPRIMARTMADDLYTVLTSIGEERVILVGFSAGMLTVYDFVDRYQGKGIEVVGLVSAEGAILDEREAQWYVDYSPIGLNGPLDDIAIDTGLVRLLAGAMAPETTETIADPAYFERVVETYYTRQFARHWHAQFSPETRADTFRVVQLDPPTDIPVVVLVSVDQEIPDLLPKGKTPEDYQDYLDTSHEFYQNWVTTSPEGSQLIEVPYSSHYIIIEQPEYIIDSIHELLAFLAQ